MGYLTNYELSSKNLDLNNDEDLNQLKQILTKETGYDWDDDLTINAKWYDHNTNMKTISALPEYKDVLFILNGHGEEEGDYWVSYFKNGKMKRYHAEVKIIYPKFNEEDLQ